MATGKSYFARPSHHHFVSSPISSSDHVFDFDESDIWNTAMAISSSPKDGAFHKPVPSSRGRKSGKAKKSAASSSLPMNIPDWSKILRGDYRENKHDYEFDDEDEEEDAAAAEEEAGGIRYPPHEFLARQKRHGAASFSVHEGIGRTLKGRDLSRVRNAIWKQTGFED
ncbi:hypothetical protein QQ045_025221 [Rhodiola kirilowii]